MVTFGGDFIGFPVSELLLHDVRSKSSMTKSVSVAPGFTQSGTSSSSILSIFMTLKNEEEDPTPRNPDLVVGLTPIPSVEKEGATALRYGEVQRDELLVFVLIVDD
ncbi:hypothetical protein OGATHE_003936 [Ogataea polymorpha]|uniref:Uncharacterized protein n=1 Tax=Ogataea polymorpha TaxID=460523 RepID=A0A9P8T4Q9_9ASCO|nr:hypothetical protein OGATHE_003936 [Ogataea polymorpha]